MRMKNLLSYLLVTRHLFVVHLNKNSVEITKVKKIKTQGSILLRRNVTGAERAHLNIHSKYQKNDKTRVFENGGIRPLRLLY